MSAKRYLTRWYYGICHRCNLGLRAPLAAPAKAESLTCPGCRYPVQVMVIHNVPLKGYVDAGLEVAVKPKPKE